MSKCPPVQVAYDNDDCQNLTFFITYRRIMKPKKYRDIPVTGKDWLLLIRDLPDGCWWAVVILLVAFVIRVLFFE